MNESNQLNQGPWTRRGELRANAQRVLGRSFALLVVFCLFSPGARSVDDGDSIQNMRSALEEWVEVRKLISKEKRDWAIGKEVLQDRIELTRAQILSIQKRTDEATDNISEAQAQLVEVETKNEALKAAASALGVQVESLETETRELVALLPEAAKSRVSLLTQRLPKTGEETDLALSDRFLNIVGIINELNKFNREIAVTSEVRTLTDGTSAEVAAMYVGLGQAYYVSPNGKFAGVGTGTAGGWSWHAEDDSAEEISKALAILKDGAVADFVHLPLKVE